MGRVGVKTKQTPSNGAACTGGGALTLLVLGDPACVAELQRVAPLLLGQCTWLHTCLGCGLHAEWTRNLSHPGRGGHRAWCVQAMSGSVCGGSGGRDVLLLVATRYRSCRVQNDTGSRVCMLISA